MSYMHENYAGKIFNDGYNTILGGGENTELARETGMPNYLMKF